MKTETYDVDGSIVTLDRKLLDEDDMYDMRTEAEFVESYALASRIEIERRNLIAHDEYQVQFCQHELFDIGTTLAEAKQERHELGMDDRVEAIQNLSSAFVEGTDDA